MNMTPEEICRSYREAKKKMEQIKILSELNATTEEEIKKILKENGYLKTGPKTAIMQTALKKPKLETPETNMQPKQEVPDAVIQLCVKRVEVIREQIDKLEKELEKINNFLARS